MKNLVFAVLLMMIWAVADKHVWAEDGGCCREAGTGAGRQYNPADPWNQSRIWRRHTGHFGLFYNCDFQEAKRFSPYICWRQSDSPYSGERWRTLCRSDWQRIKQRICDGAGTCWPNRPDHDSIPR